jgi:hypothetical protein
MPSRPRVFRYSGRIASVLTRLSGSRTKWIEQSNCAPSHLCGLKTIESARSAPAHSGRNSGQIIAEPAQAASTCR